MTQTWTELEVPRPAHDSDRAQRLQLGATKVVVDGPSKAHNVFATAPTPFIWQWMCLRSKSGDLAANSRGVAHYIGGNDARTLCEQRVGDTRAIGQRGLPLRMRLAEIMEPRGFDDGLLLVACKRERDAQLLGLTSCVLEVVFELRPVPGLGPRIISQRRAASGARDRRDG